ncbi:MAG: DUF6394 family protein [Pseudomonadota bacterium]
MNLEKVVFGFFILLALTLNLAFVVGDIDNPDHHEIWILFAAIIVNLIATGLKLGDRSYIGAVLLSTSLVADLQLLIAASVWTYADYGLHSEMIPAVMVNIVSLAAGALFANLVSVVMLVSDTLISRR